MPIFKKETDQKDKLQGVIVLGTPRSGTTLLRRLLDSHPDLSCPGETFLFKAAARFLDHDKISGGFDYGVISALEGLGYDPEDIKSRLRDFVSHFYEEMAIKEDKKIWVAKTAIDSFYIPQIAEIFSGHVKFICVTRHGLDVACSMHEFSEDLQSYITELHNYIIKYPQPFEAFAHAWADVTSNILDFANSHKDSSIVIRYEDLVAQTDSKLEEITNFIGVENHPEQTESILKHKALGGIGDWKSFKKDHIETSSINRWETQLSDTTIDLLAPIVNPVLSLAGYDEIGSDDEDAKRRKELAMMMMQAQSE